MTMTTTFQEHYIYQRMTQDELKLFCVYKVTPKQLNIIEIECNTLSELTKNKRFHPKVYTDGNGDRHYNIQKRVKKYLAPSVGGDCEEVFVWSTPFLNTRQKMTITAHAYCPSLTEELRLMEDEEEATPWDEYKRLIESWERTYEVVNATIKTQKSKAVFPICEPEEGIGLSFLME